MKGCQRWSVGARTNLALQDPDGIDSSEMKDMMNFKTEVLAS